MMTLSDRLKGRTPRIASVEDLPDLVPAGSTLVLGVTSYTEFYASTASTLAHMVKEGTLPDQGKVTLPQAVASVVDDSKNPPVLEGTEQIARTGADGRED